MSNTDINKNKIPPMCKKCMFLYNQEYCLAKEEYVTDLKVKNCDDKMTKYISKD